MLDGFLNDLKKMTFVGIIIFFIGFIISTVFLIFMGLTELRILNYMRLTIKSLITRVRGSGKE